MTTIHFHYTDSYNNPSRGSLAFMPHRRHAANETEVLPKPFTIPLLNGEVTVNLQPNSSSWVWIVTEYFEGVSTSFYTTVPDRDGVLEHTELVHISPSSIPAPYDAVEPAWWAEMRQYKATVSDTLLQSGEALTEAQAAIETGRESVERTQHNASVAGAYADESRQSSYDAREYRDMAEQWRNEAQEQADRAATGPESAAERAETAAERAETSETRARDYQDETRNSAANARASETASTGAASTATERASDARNEANRAEAEANRAKGYADELMDGPREYVEQSREARDDSQGFANDSAGYRDATQLIHDDTKTLADAVSQDRGVVATHHDEVQHLYDDIIAGTVPQYVILKGLSEVVAPSTWHTASFDDVTQYGSAFTVDNNSVITVHESGLYSISANIRFDPNGYDGSGQLRIRAGDGNGVSVSGAGTAIQASLSVVRLTAGDEITAIAYHTASERSFTDLSTYPSSLRVHRIGPAN